MSTPAPAPGAATVDPWCTANRHGTASAYRRAACRCRAAQDAVAAERRASRARRAERERAARASQPPPSPPPAPVIDEVLVERLAWATWHDATAVLSVALAEASAAEKLAAAAVLAGWERTARERYGNHTPHQKHPVLNNARGAAGAYKRLGLPERTVQAIFSGKANSDNHQTIKCPPPW